MNQRQVGRTAVAVALGLALGACGGGGADVLPAGARREGGRQRDAECGGECELRARVLNQRRREPPDYSDNR